MVLESGEECTAEVILSSAGFFETMALCGEAGERPPADAGRLSFVESIAVLDRPPAAFGHEATIVFFADTDRFEYAAPDDLVDLRSGVACCPNNYAGQGDLREGVFRLTWLASYDRWAALGAEEYAAAKRALRERFVERASQYLPGVSDGIVYLDMFTPRTIRQYTGHWNGAVYGAPRKVRDGRTRWRNLFLCGTDQGYVGIIGAMLSGITMANMHVLGAE
jgi:phytoene dehydrogenase-like protein